MLPESVRVIGNSAFSGCAGLNRETIELQQFTELGRYAFSGCTGIQTVTAGEGATEIPEGCFSGCSGITSLDLGSVESIGQSAFRNCVGLSEVYAPDTIKNIGNYAFDGSAAHMIVYPYSCALEYAIGNKMNYTLREYRSYVLPANLTSINESAFEGVPTDMIIIPSSVSSIGMRAFEDSNVRVVVFIGEECAISNDAFEGCRIVRIVCNQNSQIVQWASEHGYQIFVRE